jgi:glyoxylase-like metal-dependent hydrolase (beta-lactamase superfamily II)
MASGELILIEGDNRARFPDSHCLFIDDEIPAVIDPATRKDHLEELNRQNGIQLVINTHYHVDHIRYDGLFPEAEIVANAIDAPAIESIDEMARAVGVEEVPWLSVWKQVMVKRWGFSERKVDRKISDGDEINLGNNTIRFIHAPGHTAGHTCVEFVEKEAVFLGDIDMGPFGPWYANRGSDIEDFLRSIERLKFTDAQTWYMSHGEGMIEGDITDKLDAFASVIHERDHRVLDFLEQERSWQEIVEATLIYRNRWEPHELFDFFEGMMVGKHIERLTRQGLVAREGDRYRAAG